MSKTPVDLPKQFTLCHGIAAEAFAAVERTAFSTPWSAAAFVKSEHRLGIWIAESSVPVAFIYVQRVADEAEILRIAVDPRWRRWGLARYLWATLLKTATPPLARVYLEVAQSNRPALAFYRTIGFVENGRRNDYYGAGDDALTMTWSATSGA